MHRLFIFLFISCMSNFSYAFPCYINFIKDSCWTDYDVKLKVIDANTEKVMTTIDVPQGQPWSRARFECEPKETFQLQAVFSPIFWQSDKDKIYVGQRYWSMPRETGDAVAWVMNICYSADFIGVPFPPDVAGPCKCDTKAIPKVQP